MISFAKIVIKYYYCHDKCTQKVLLTRTRVGYDKKTFGLTHFLPTNGECIYYSAISNKEV